ncbi:SDR family NAD(P)-dependent oxidoreductase [Nocardioides sp. CFH 31398]|uniref:SDR family NAD(P)-dependent oxidoreductase n=1 Tax=Nocardioides sp. CFH 31398 TaxID=2919579 RepID=UPI001F054B4A|nr:SDR family NAD(P)-dependent oxidoreductase [Nocardioides sp. CFH 31398]MCH1865343.1 SDR family NAD(P)-dependent oxidoreductase [Nocardioides sp. CFH 31398]
MRLPPALARGVDTVLDRSVVPGYTKIGPAVRRRLGTWPSDPPPTALNGRTALVTGASSGLGIAAAEGLARLGAQVRLVVRNPQKGEQAADEVRRAVPGADLRVERCDVGDLDDVRRFVEAYDGDAVDVLVHNAGVMPPERTESPQGHELSMAVHVLGPVLMSELLAPRMSDTRVVFVTSGGMYPQKLRADDPGYLDGDYSPTTAYARSKRAQVELLPVLAQRWQAQRTMVAAMHPGWAATPGVTESLPTFDKVLRPVLRTPGSGIETAVWLAATTPVPESGLLWHDRRPRPTSLLPSTRPTTAQRQLLWDFVKRATQLP